MQPEVMTGGEAENEGIDEVELTFILATTAYVSLSQSRSAEKRLKIKRGLLLVDIHVWRCATSKTGVRETTRASRRPALRPTWCRTRPPTSPRCQHLSPSTAHSLTYRNTMGAMMLSPSADSI